jgi:hypothetical protein
LRPFSPRRHVPAPPPTPLSNTLCLAELQQLQMMSASVVNTQATTSILSPTKLLPMLPPPKLRCSLPPKKSARRLK